MEISISCVLIIYLTVCAFVLYKNERNKRNRMLLASLFFLMVPFCWFIGEMFALVYPVASFLFSIYLVAIGAYMFKKYKKGAVFYSFLLIFILQLTSLILCTDIANNNYKTAARLALFSFDREKLNSEYADALKKEYNAAIKRGDYIKIKELVERFEKEKISLPYDIVDAYLYLGEYEKASDIIKKSFYDLRHEFAPYMALLYLVQGNNENDAALAKKYYTEALKWGSLCVYNEPYKLAALRNLGETKRADEEYKRLHGEIIIKYNEKELLTNQCVQCLNNINTNYKTIFKERYSINGFPDREKNLGSWCRFY